MEVVLTVDKEYEKELVITAPWEMIRADYDSLLQHYSKLQVKGFRPGKSPVGLIEAHFAQQIKNDLLAATATRLCRRAMNEKSLVAGTPVEVSDGLLQKNGYLQFKASFVEMPEFELPDYACLGLESGARAAQLDEISQKLLERTIVSLHPCFVANELKYSEHGVAGENEKKNAEARVKLMLILKKIALQDQIEIDEQDIEARIKIVAADNDVSPEELKKFLIENRGMARFADSLLAEAVLDYIIEIQH